MIHLFQCVYHDQSVLRAFLEIHSHLATPVINWRQPHHACFQLSYTYVALLVPDSSLCRAAAPRLYVSASTAAPRLCPLQLLLAACVCISCCSQLRPLQLLPDCVRFGCCSPIVSAPTAAPRLHPLQLLLPDCIRFDCCSPIACIRL